VIPGKAKVLCCDIQLRSRHAQLAGIVAWMVYGPREGTTLPFRNLADTAVTDSDWSSRAISHA
jgi:hypothetical protein